MGAVTIGLDLGQRVDPTAFAVVEAQRREEGGRRVVHHTARSLQRLTLGTPYPRVVDRVVEVAANVVRLTNRRPRLYVDATGVGTPILDLLREARVRADLFAVYFTHGDRRHVDEEAHQITLGKAWLVSRLQALVQTGRLHLPATPAAASALARELLDYEIRVDQNANDKYGAFKVGTHDDLVTALGLATQDDGPKVTGSGRLVMGSVKWWGNGLYAGPDRLISRNGGPWGRPRQPLHLR